MSDPSTSGGRPDRNLESFEISVFTSPGRDVVVPVVSPYVRRGRKYRVPQVRFPFRTSFRPRGTLQDPCPRS